MNTKLGTNDNPSEQNVLFFKNISKLLQHFLKLVRIHSKLIDFNDDI